MFEYILKDLSNPLKMKVFIILCIITFIVILWSYLLWNYFKTDEEKSKT
jgi:hypothetical protein